MSENKNVSKAVLVSKPSTQALANIERSESLKAFQDRKTQEYKAKVQAEALKALEQEKKVQELKKIRDFKLNIIKSLPKETREFVLTQAGAYGLDSKPVMKVLRPYLPESMKE